MKILVVCQYYYPEPFRISDICEELARRGNDIMVITGLPNYPMGEIYDGYRNGEKRNEVINGVKVHRCEMIPRKRGAVNRILNYFSYACSSARYIDNLDGDYDVVLVNQLSPVMMANAGIKYKKKHGVKLVMYCLDLWPESLIAGGIKRGSLIYKVFHRISEKIYRQADKLLITSQSFAEYFDREFGIRNAEYLPQYAESIFEPEQCRKEPDDVIDLMFAGNVGTMQSVKTIIEAARLTSDRADIHWHIIGDGIELDDLKKQADDLDNVIFHGRKPLEEMPKYYAMADAMLVTMQKDPILSLTLPGKVQTYMAAGKPIIGAIDGETAIVIKDANCGLCSGAEDAAALVKSVLEFAAVKNYRELGNNAACYYEHEFSKTLFFDNLTEKLTSELRGSV